MFDAIVENVEPGRVMRYSLTREGDVLTFADVLALWEADANFCCYCSQLLADSPFAGFRWETPALTKSSTSRAFEFVLISSPAFCSRPTDQETYANYFTDDDADEGIVAFANLRGDATLVVPSPRAELESYGHLAAFVRHAPKRQLDAFWRVVSRCVQSHLGHAPLWLSTAGGGGAWLHVRLDSRPKYYGYTPYKSARHSTGF